MPNRLHQKPAAKTQATSKPSQSKSSKSLLALSLQLGQQGGDLSRARGSQGMSQGDSAALGVHLGHQKSWDFHGISTEIPISTVLSGMIWLI